MSEQLIEVQHSPIPLKGVKNIVEQMENNICKIDINENKGTGFICKILDKLYLITNSDILNEEYIEENEIIEISINNKPKKIKIDMTRKTYTNKDLDVTFIEINPNEDNINNYLEIDEEDINETEDKIELEYKNKSIYMLHYPRGELSISCGVTKEIKEGKKIEYLCSTEEESSGSPILSLQTYKVIGIHSSQGDKNINNGIFIKYAINEFINSKNIYKNEINIKLRGWESNVRIFGEKFVENNKNNIELIINGERSKLIPEYELNEGENDITIIIKNKLTNLECMFDNCHSLYNINDLKYLNTKDITNFSYMFYKCSSLSDIKPLKNWNVSNGNNFSYMFYECSRLSDVKGLENWNVSNGNNFGYMFSGCSSLSNVKGLENLNLSNGNNFEYMFSGCSSLSDVKGLENWNLSNGKYFTGILDKCSSLSDINAL